MRPRDLFRLALSTLTLSIVSGCGEFDRADEDAAKCGDPIAGVWIKEEVWADNESGEALTLLPGGKAILTGYSIRYPNPVGGSRSTGNWSASGATATVTLTESSYYDNGTSWKPATTITGGRKLVLTVSGNEAKATDDGKTTDPFTRGTTCGNNALPVDLTLLGKWAYNPTTSEFFEYHFKIDGTVVLRHDSLTELTYLVYTGTWATRSGTVEITWFAARSVTPTSSKDISVPAAATLTYEKGSGDQMILGGIAASRGKSGGGGDD